MNIDPLMLPNPERKTETLVPWSNKEIPYSPTPPISPLLSIWRVEVLSILCRAASPGLERRLVGSAPRVDE